MSAPQQLVRLPVSQILAFWRPGSRGDEWTWRDEYAELIAKPETAALAVREQLLAVLQATAAILTITTTLKGTQK